MPPSPEAQKLKTPIATRIGTTMWLLALALLVLVLNQRVGSEPIYYTFVAAHALLYTGYCVATGADLVARRPFSAVRFVLVITFAFLLGITGPICMSAAAAARR